MTTYKATIAGQTFTTTSVGANFAVVRSIYKSVAIATAERKLDSATSRIGLWVAQLGETEGAIENDQLTLKEISDLKKFINVLNLIDGAVFYELVGWTGTEENARKKARSVGGDYVASRVDL